LSKRLDPKDYNKLSLQVLNRDGYKCRNCGFRNTLCLHHLIYRSHGGEDTMENLITLCNFCHKSHHDGKLGIEVLQTLGENDVVIKFTRKGNWRPE
jgi:5-methylcytosine-specific restriction endonuclease McrA